MKQFLFFSYNTFAKANTFIKSKDGYLIGVSMVAKKYPTFYEDFFIIIGLDFNEKLFYSRIFLLLSDSISMKNYFIRELIKDIIDIVFYWMKILNLLLKRGILLKISNLMYLCLKI